MTAVPAMSRPLTLPSLTATPTIWAITLFTALTIPPLLAAYALDPRELLGANVWLKPLKFHVALTVYTGTIALYASLLPPETFASRPWRLFFGFVAACVVAEVVWLSAASALGVGSHFNRDGIWDTIYMSMGIAAVGLTSLSLATGITFFRHRTSTLHLGIGIGLILTFLLTFPIAGYMSSTDGHFVGIPTTGATVPFFGWSREVGDFRIAHFLATHAMHAIPLAALTGSRATVWSAAAGFTALTLWCFARALQGLPPF
jgi:hypothetical protein